ncbi:t-SNARE [Dendrothele bispora CBS 962.96]|uniref:t-SNARE n=1 Tax=Dendrothele bispora (strain CBS 962.96) TaxID=1314807 RepID=A0A4S8LT62_DENBC|nr:t-SNARE [Dendrothele bispora CBS 962.96]
MRIRMFRFPDVRDQIVYPYDLKHESARFHSVSLNQRAIPSLNGLDAKHQPAEVNDPQDVGSLVTAHTRNHSETRPISGSSVRYSESLHDSARDQSVIGSTSTATVRQMQLQEEADDLRQQVRQLQQTVDTSNDDMQGMQVAMRRMMEHILSLESQLNSDWARGLTDEPPPMYGELDSNIRTISTLRTRSLNTDVSGSKESKAALAASLDKLTTETTSLTGSIKQKIHRLVGDHRLARNGKIQRTEIDLRRDHLNRIRSKFTGAIQEFQSVERDFKSKFKERAVNRQYKIVKPDATPEEIREVTSGDLGTGTIFAEATLASSNRYAETRSAYREAQERQEELKKIERTLAELAQLYQDMSILIQQQDEAIVSIENTASDVEKTVEKGLEHTENAVDHARRACRLRIIFFWICVVIILIIGLAVGLSIGLKN